MKIVEFVNSLGLGGTVRASSTWSRYLKDKGHDISVLYLREGPGKSRFHDLGISTRQASNAADIKTALEDLRPDVIHAHAPGFQHAGDVLGEALLGMSKRPPVAQTNIFGLFANPKENAWTDLRMFVSWTSCVQAAERNNLRLDEHFFEKATVVVNPVWNEEAVPDPAKIREFRTALGFQEDDIVFGKFSRPDPIKWSGLSLEGFQLALKVNPKMKLLIREAPPEVPAAYRELAAKGQVVFLPMTADSSELQLTMASVDVVLHSSAIGESFGYGLAEPMALGKPVIANSIPWRDQAQVELIDHGKGGFLASTPQSTRDCILKLAGDSALRKQMGEYARQRIGRIADYETSGARLEESLRAVMERRPNPRASEDLATAIEAADYLHRNQFGHTLRDSLVLRASYFPRQVKRRLEKIWKRQA